MTAGARDLLDFWFSPAVAAKWFAPDPALDRDLARRFGPLVERALAGGLGDWTVTPDGALALVILLDQLPRNLWRGSARAFAGDERARRVADDAIGRGFDLRLEPGRRTFLYLPFEHSEDLADQRRAVALFRERGTADGLDWAEKHLAVIERFGRFPHRNAALGRVSTPDEEAYLRQPGAGF
ncbi:MAG: DUF924 family protein [Pseudomonadota bacterium]